MIANFKLESFILNYQPLAHARSFARVDIDFVDLKVAFLSLMLVRFFYLFCTLINLIQKFIMIASVVKM